GLRGVRAVVRVSGDDPAAAGAEPRWRVRGARAGAQRRRDRTAHPPDRGVAAMSAGRARRPAVLALLVAVGCTGGDNHVESPTGAVECRSRLAGPSVFRVVECFRELYSDYFGMRLGL